MKNIKNWYLIFICSLFVPSCTTYYNYDLSIKDLDSLPKTKSCIEKYTPHSIDAIKGQEIKELQILALELDNYKDEIRDSLYADSIYIDSVYQLKFNIEALDPDNKISSFEVEKYFYKDTEE